MIMNVKQRRIPNCTKSNIEPQHQVTSISGEGYHRFSFKAVFLYSLQVKLGSHLAMIFLPYIWYPHYMYLIKFCKGP